MASNAGWTRRDLFRAGLSASALSLVSSVGPHALQAGDARSGDDRRLFLFVDWFHVKKGELKVVLDPDRVSPGGKQQLESYARDFGKTFDQGTHGFKPADVPSGIRITQEVAERSSPWLVADRPWEKGISSVTVLRDEGRFRCWYTSTLRGEKAEVTVDQGRVMELGGGALAYAESEDGLSWTKPSLELVRREGWRGNNFSPRSATGGRSSATTTAPRRGATSASSSMSCRRGRSSRGPPRRSDTGSSGSPRRTGIAGRRTTGP